MIVGVTGHRKLDGNNFLDNTNKRYQNIFSKTKEIFSELNPEQVITGMALGFDQLVAWVCIELEIPYICAIPHDHHENPKWPEKSKNNYRELIENAVKVEIVSPGKYAKWKMQVRNEYIVDNCDILVAYYLGGFGGTANCINYAKSEKKEIIYVETG